MQFKKQNYRKFTTEENDTWKILFQNLDEARSNLIIPEFNEGVRKLGFSPDRIPNLDEINDRLCKLTGWKGVPVEGLEGIDTFYPGLSRREFPIGNFIRDRKDVSYTPAPDVFHDLYGHLPFFTDPVYADFFQKFGELACRYQDSSEKQAMFERFFWFTAEFGLVNTSHGIKIFGAGIASSAKECAYALSSDPQVVPFDINVITHQDFDVSRLQGKFFLIENLEEFWKCLESLEEYVKSSSRYFSFPPT